MNGKILQKATEQWHIAIVALLLISPFTAFRTLQAQVNWHTIEEASASKIGDKLYFIDFYTTWCGYCKKMDRETFTDPTVAKILNHYYYPVKFDAESHQSINWKGQTYQPGAANRRGSTHQFATGLQGFPSFVLFRADGSPLQVIPGFYPPDQFVIVLWYFASGDSDRYPFDRYQRIFDKEIRPQMDKKLK